MNHTFIHHTFILKMSRNYKNSYKPGMYTYVNTYFIYFTVYMQTVCNMHAIYLQMCLSIISLLCSDNQLMEK